MLLFGLLAGLISVFGGLAVVGLIVDCLFGVACLGFCLCYCLRGCLFVSIATFSLFVLVGVLFVVGYSRVSLLVDFGGLSLVLLYHYVITF